MMTMMMMMTMRFLKIETTMGHGFSSKKGVLKITIEMALSIRCAGHGGSPKMCLQGSVERARPIGRIEIVSPLYNR